ncbi:little elongation complex subunit 2 [Scleropages formosus]|uniref:Interactor of little elongation complex ELL subunit 2 n=1 Tax=Scleropages formosus TaxID=113540 RepID=A0A8C9V7M2_SCLFO|nr:little elongation complex subunit 2 [Scleropages formosus]
MELTWEDTPFNGTVCFSRDLYDKFSLGSTIKDLWAIAHGPPDAAEVRKEETAASVKQESAPTCGQDVHHWNTSSDESEAFPEPRIPFPCYSCLNSREQQLYLRKFMNKNSTEAFKQQEELVRNEVAGFMRYLQDVARACSEDYRHLCEGATHYMEECLRASMEKVKSYPQFYLIHEMTSITGGKFNPDLSLKFEKRLLTLGKVQVLDCKKLPKDVQLPVDYGLVASEVPPDKKAKQMHSDISADVNAQKLCEKYKPHVCLTSGAFFTLLNNQGPEYSETWEVPVWVRTTVRSGNSSRKEVYIDSPLVKTDMTEREKNSLFHEESLKLSLKKTSSKKAAELTLEKPPSLQERCPRSLVCFDDTGVDFEADFTDLETFGESSCISKKQDTDKQPNQSLHRSKPASSSTCGKLSVSTNARSVKTQSTQKANAEDSSWTDIEDTSMIDSFPAGTPLSQKDLSMSSPAGEIKQLQDSPLAKRQRRTESTCCASDSEEDRLVIDHYEDFPETNRPVSQAAHSSTKAPSFSDAIPDTPRSPSPAAEGPTSRRCATKVPQSCDQLGKILRMQSKLLKPTAQPTPEPMSPSTHTALPAQAQPQSLVKPCVASYLGATQSPVRGTVSAVGSAAADADTGVQRKTLLSEELLAAEEDEGNYQQPDEGNLVYKLYSLQDVLLMVRCSVPFARSKKSNMDSKTIVPFHLLSKLEYQLCYGVECFTKTEFCQLWAERLLHSASTTFVGHINAYTSKLFLMEELSPQRMRSMSCDFSPAKSLNTLHHLLKKVVGLQEGRYLLNHKAGEPIVTIAKATDGKKISRATYDLHQAHSGIPQPPANGAVPWVPVDPSRVLSFHLKHGRVPCTFPPLPVGNTPGNKAGNVKGACAAVAKGPSIAGRAQAGMALSTGNQDGSKKKKKKKNKGNRAKRFQKWQENKKAKQTEQQRQMQKAEHQPAIS